MEKYIENLRKIPVIFKKDVEVDERFVKLKIYLMHTGINLNGSYFSKEVVEKAIPTLSNTPILGFIEVNKEDEEDFSDHRMELQIEDGTYKWDYKCSAFGVIPEDNNAHWETVKTDDGDKEFLVCDGLLWTKWDKPLEILESNDGIKGQSMELSNEFSGKYRKDGIFAFEDFKFFGATILGDDVTPAMTGAKVEVQFSAEDIHVQIQAKMEEYKLLVASKIDSQTSSEPSTDDVLNNSSNSDSNSSGEGGEKVDEKLAILQKYSLTQEQLTEAGVDFENISLEDLESKAKEFAEKASHKEDEPNKDFAVTAMQMMTLLQDRLNPGEEKDDWGYPITRYWYIDHTDTMVICNDSQDDWMLVGFNYTLDGDVPVIDFNSKQMLKRVYAPLEGQTAQTQYTVPRAYMERQIEIAKKTVETDMSTKLTEANAETGKIATQMEALTAEVTELREFKASKITAERKANLDEVFSKFSQLTEEEISDIKTKAYSTDVAVEAVENELYALVGKKVASTFSANKAEKKTGYSFDHNTESGKGPIWLGMVEKHVSKE